MNEPTTAEPAAPESGFREQPEPTSVAEAFGDESPPQTPPEGGQPQGGTPEGAPEKPSFPTPEQITQSVREGLRQSREETPPAPREYSQAELDQLFNVYNPSPEVIQRLLAGGEDAIKAFVEIRDGLSKQFGTLLQYQLELARRDLTGQMDPALKFVAEQNAAKDRADFFEQHPDLKDHETLTQTVFNALKAEGYQAKDKAEAYKTLADRTRALLPTASNGSGAAPSSGARTTKTSSTERRPASLSSGSQAGGGGGSAPQAPFPGAEVFL